MSLRIVSACSLLRTKYDALARPPDNYISDLGSPASGTTIHRVFRSYHSARPSPASRRFCQATQHRRPRPHECVLSLAQLAVQALLPYKNNLLMDPRSARWLPPRARTRIPMSGMAPTSTSLSTEVLHGVHPSILAREERQTDETRILWETARHKDVLRDGCPPLTKERRAEKMPGERALHGAPRKCHHHRSGPANIMF